MDVRCEFLPGPQVGQVTAPFPGQINLPSEPFVFVEKYDPAAVPQRFGGADGRHHSGGAAAYDGQGRVHQLLK